MFITEVRGELGEPSVLETKKIFQQNEVFKSVCCCKEIEQHENRENVIVLSEQFER